MTEEGRKRLNTLSKGDIEAAIHGLTEHVKARLRVGSPLDRTKTGAHCEKNLGMEPVNYYVGECVKRLWDADGWEWKFDQFDLQAQLIRIANSIISKKVRDYKRSRNELPMIESLEEIDREPVAEDEDTPDLEEISAILHEFVKKEIVGDFELEYYTSCFLEKKSKDEIAAEMDLPKPQIEVLHRKLFRKAMKFGIAGKEEVNL